jgi:hypothetical protein
MRRVFSLSIGHLAAPTALGGRMAAPTDRLFEELARALFCEVLRGPRPLLLPPLPSGRRPLRLPLLPSGRRPPAALGGQMAAPTDRLFDGLARASVCEVLRAPHPLLLPPLPSGRRPLRLPLLPSGRRREFFDSSIGARYGSTVEFCAVPDLRVHQLAYAPDSAEQTKTPVFAERTRINQPPSLITADSLSAHPDGGQRFRGRAPLCYTASHLPKGAR